MARDPSAGELTGQQRRSLRRLALALFWLLLLPAVLGVLEVVVRVSDMDKHALEPLLYYFDAAPRLHMPSDDPRAIFTLRPSVSSTFVHKGSGRSMSFSHNSLGYRGKEARAARTPGVFRIIALGASNMYGAEVGDEHTMPVYLQRLLNRRFEGRFEVWNQGVQSHSLQQVCAKAERALRLHRPDMLLLQLAHNMRRTFLDGHPVGRHFDEDPSLYRENLRYIPGAGRAWALPLVQRWALYRTAVAALNYWDRVPTNNVHYPTADAINKEAFLRFHDRYKDRVHIVFLPNLPVFGLAMSPAHRRRFAAVPSIDVVDRALLQDALRPEFHETHPPPHVYEANAYVVARELARIHPKLFRPRGTFTVPPVATFGAAVKDRFRRDAMLFDHIVTRYAAWGKLEGLLRNLGKLARAEPNNPLFPLYQAQCAAQLEQEQMARAYLMEAEALRPGPDLREAVRRTRVIMGAPTDGKQTH